MRPSRRNRKPREYAISGAWPGAVMDDHIGAEVTQAIVRALADVVARYPSLNAFATEMQLNRQMLANILEGASWPDVLTIATLERKLGVRLYPDHLEWPDGKDPGVARDGDADSQR